MNEERPDSTVSEAASPFAQLLGTPPVPSNWNAQVRYVRSGKDVTPHEAAWIKEHGWKTLPERQERDFGIT